MAGSTADRGLEGIEVKDSTEDRWVLGAFAGPQTPASVGIDRREQVSSWLAAARAGRHRPPVPVAGVSSATRRRSRLAASQVVLVVTGF
ncbi:hypothetical protein [Streptomyces sp. NPDC041003]|uniref:hypothetical protein n=1 Tax=Streptomyces sp. NPDC041003 TaxID=3155730 RepID=UPI0033C9D122